jgi:site-specific DNA recombinase
MKVDKSTEQPDSRTGILYLRVSTKEQAAKGGQAEGFSIPAQREALRRKAQSMNAVIVAEFVDAGESAKSADRPDLQRMLRYLVENHVDYVLVHKVDRLARNRVDDVEITLAIKKSGATLVSATENIDETPSGTLLHGIMSSIAEFYSHNLAAEVHKGMSQKAKTGGTPGRAPVGYRNIGRLTPEGREERTVDVDPERAELISWSFTAFATGDWTLRSMADELDLRGLTTRQTPKQPSRPVRPNVLHDMLTNPYYKGDVVYRGVAHPGNHQPLTDPVTWQAVQDVLAAHAVGEKQRDHPHYLKSSVFCGDCGSRLVITNARNRHGTIYPYFICLGRHQKRTRCTRKAMLVARVEVLVEEYWAAAVRLDPAEYDALAEGLLTNLSASREGSRVERQQLQSAKAALMAKRQKLIEAIYSSAMPMDLIAGEQDRLTKQIATVEQRLSAMTVAFECIEANLLRVLDLARDGHADYLGADPVYRRLLNQALFTHLYIDEHGVRAAYAGPFDALRSQPTLGHPPAAHPDHETGPNTMGDVLDRQFVTSNNRKTPGAQRATRGLLDHIPTPVVGFGGLKVTTMAALRDSLSNLSPPLLRVLDIRARRLKTGSTQRRFDTTKQLIAQTGATDPTVVRLQVKENHKLSTTATEQLVQANKAGMSQAKLAHQFGIHVETVNRHLRRRRQAPKLGNAAIRYRTLPRGYVA